MQTKLLFLALAAAMPLAAADHLSLQQRWALAPGDRSYLNTSTTERGVSYNPITGHLILVSRAGGINIHILDAATGDELGEMNTDGLSGGTFVLSKVGVADDGAIYAANFGTIGGSTPTYNIYRWADENAIPTVAYAGDPGEGNIQQWGTSFDVRGAGADTEIIAGSTAGGIAGYFTTSDGANFNSKILTASGNPDVFGIGLVFGAGNTLWAKAVENSLTHLSFDPNAGTAATLRRYAVTNFPASVGPIGVDTTNQLLAAVNITTPDMVNLYSIEAADADGTNAPVLIDTTALPTDNGNSLSMGAIDFAPGRVFVLDSNNGLVAYDLVASSEPVPASIVGGPVGTQTVKVGRTATFTVYPAGTAPFVYNWTFTDSNGVETAIGGATNATYRISSVRVEDEGFYRVTVSNPAGSMTSADAELIVDPNPGPDSLVLLWHLPAGSRPYLTGSNNQRGLGYNPVTGHLILVSRAGGISVHIIDAKTGADLGEMDTTGIEGGTFPLSKIEVADDGVIYGSNFGSINATSTPTFNIYRWANESATPTLAFSDNPDPFYNPGEQWGNDFALRGGGVNTQILAPSRTDVVALLTTTDGEHFTSHPLPTGSGPKAYYRGVAFGIGDTFWGTAENEPLYRASFDLLGEFAYLDQSWEWDDLPTTITPIAVDAGHALLAGLSVASPDMVSLYDISDEVNGPTLMQSKIFPSDSANTLYAGALDFGGNKLFVLDTNNGLAAYDLPFLHADEPPVLSVVREGDGSLSIAWPEASTGFILESTDAIGSGTWTAVGATPVLANGQSTVTVQPIGSARFFRLRK